MSAPKNRKASACLAAAAALVVLAVVLTFGGTLLSPRAEATAKGPDQLGAMNPGSHQTAKKLSKDTLTPEGSRGACWPSNTFNHVGDQPKVVNYLQGNDSRDTHDTYKVVTERDTAWLSANRDYYHFTPGETDVQYHKGLVLKKLTYSITVLDTYCPSGQMNVREWQVQTLQPGEMVYFLKGHAPGDGTNIVPVRKANCGNFLLPPPAQPTRPTPHHATPAKSHHHASPVCTKNCSPKPPPVCTKNCSPPPPHQCVKPPYPGNGWAYDSKTCTYHKVPQTKDCMLNGGPNCPPNGGHQDPQNNTTSQNNGANHGSTPGASTAPKPAPQGPAPVQGQPAPDPVVNNDGTGGINSGSQNGSGTPGGTTSDSNGTQGGGSTPGSGPTDNTHGSDNNGTSGNGASTGDGTITNPFG